MTEGRPAGHDEHTLAMQEALHEFNEAIRRDAGLVKAYSARANLHLRLGNIDQAIADADRAVRLAPDLAEAQQMRRAAYGFRGEAPPT